MYAQDYDEMLPRYADQVCTGRTLWWAMAEPYIKNKATLKCPSASCAAPVNKGDYGSIGVSYPHVIGCGTGVIMPNIRAASEAALLMDTGWCKTNNPNGTNFPLAYCMGVGNFDPNWACCQNGDKWPHSIAARHMEFVNVLFCDGHAKATRVSYMLPGSYAAATVAHANFWNHPLDNSGRPTNVAN